MIIEGVRIVVIINELRVSFWNFTHWHSYRLPSRIRLGQLTLHGIAYLQMENHDYIIVELDSPTHFPDIYHHTTDILDIAFLKNTNLQYTNQNLSDLLSNHNPMFLDLSTQTCLSDPTFNKKVLINWNRFAKKLHETILNQNSTINSMVSLDVAVVNIANKY